MSAEDYYAHLDEIDRFANVPTWREEHADDIEPWWERFQDERDEIDDYEGYRDEVER